MNTELLIECIGNIDDEFVDLYAQYQKPHISRVKVAIAAVAACMIVSAGTAVLFLKVNSSVTVDRIPRQSSLVTDSAVTSNEKVILSKALTEALDKAASENDKLKIRVVTGTGELGAHDLGLGVDENGVILASVKEIRGLTAQSGASMKVYLADELNSSADKNADNILSDMPTITDGLSKEMKAAGDSEMIPVAIELKDDLDLTKLEEQAARNAGVTNDELTALESESISADPDRQQELKAVYDRISQERIKLLNHYYSEKNKGFIEAAGLNGYTCSDVSELTSFIGHIELPKAVILRIARLEDVAFLWYAGEDAGRTF